VSYKTSNTVADPLSLKAARYKYAYVIQGCMFQGGGKLAKAVKSKLEKTWLVDCRSRELSRRFGGGVLYIRSLIDPYGARYVTPMAANGTRLVEASPTHQIAWNVVIGLIA
jgi:hypothetical protein